jgi:hypothetical protein
MRAIACHDGTEISADSAFELLKAFSSKEREMVSRRAGQQDIVPQINSNPQPVDPGVLW